MFLATRILHTLTFVRGVGPNAVTEVDAAGSRRSAVVSPKTAPHRYRFTRPPTPRHQGSQRERERVLERLQFCTQLWSYIFIYLFLYILFLLFLLVDDVSSVTLDMLSEIGALLFDKRFMQSYTVIRYQDDETTTNNGAGGRNDDVRTPIRRNDNRHSVFFR